MRLLIFEVSVPNRYSDDTQDPIAGWQDSLEELIHKYTDIELGVAFESKKEAVKKIIDGITYFPIHPQYTLKEKIENRYTWKISKDKLIPLAVNIIKEFKPELIHVFGSEWCWGQVASYVSVPVIIHMQGSMPAYVNALYPPNYNKWDQILCARLNLTQQIKMWFSRHKYITWKAQEENTLRVVDFYMGRTEWDYNMIKLYNPTAHYFHCDEVLRPTFINSTKHWKPSISKKIRIVTTGCSSLWKGCDTILKTAHLLRERNIDFEWFIAGNMPMKQLIERKEKLKFSQENINILGFLNANKLQELLLSCDMYVHTAYIDNSPNSICEAQYLGLPIIATYVGGIPSIVKNNKEGFLIPANDPYTLTQTIIELSVNKQLQMELGAASVERAKMRHNPHRILEQLLSCYDAVLKEYRNK